MEVDLGVKAILDGADIDGGGGGWSIVRLELAGFERGGAIMIMTDVAQHQLMHKRMDCLGRCDG